MVKKGARRSDVAPLHHSSFLATTPRWLTTQLLAGEGCAMCVLPGPLVLGKGPLNALTPTPDMDRTVSRRSERSSRTALMGEQPNPWNILQPQVAKSRHRGAKPSRRCELLGKISLLSLE
ncbi:cell wall-associated hydrolase [Artemisia annua]|uniref:Cell wall-associated hydrolase n=1 Tax=Artemisia annua TaxID=35608 RepID=A0A2U1NFY8_ARTAN|nr:cell wall-associated hydrolase [Artemisia annua]